MTRYEAYCVMCKKGKVAHVTFPNNKYLHLICSHVYTNEGHYFEEKFFNNEIFKEGWIVLK